MYIGILGQQTIGNIVSISEVGHLRSLMELKSRECEEWGTQYEVSATKTCFLDVDVVITSGASQANRRAASYNLFLFRNSTIRTCTLI